MNIVEKIDFQVVVKKAVAGPPIGPILGMRGLNIMDFCKEFNFKTSNYKDGVVLKTLLYIGSDKSFKIGLGLPTVSFFLKKYNENFLSKKYDDLFVSIRFLYLLARLQQLNNVHIELKSLVCSLIGTVENIGFILKE